MLEPTEVPGVSLAALEAFLRERRPQLLAGPLRVSLLAGGRSNLTYLLTDGTGRWVLRRPPLGHVLDTAHDVQREYRVLGGLHRSDVPVPEPLVHGGPEVMGAPFFVMEYVHGVILRERDQLAALDGNRAVALAAALGDVLAQLHRIDPASVGLGDLGRPEGYLERQCRRWAQQLADSRTRELPDLVDLGQRLGRRCPSGQPSAIVHGDYRLDNVLVDSGDGRVLGVLDWEMATLGDPLTDLASLVVWWDGFRGLDSPVAAVPGDVPGFPPGAVLVEDYARRTGRDLDQLPWYVGFAFYKVAVIFEGIHFRSGQGLTVGEGFHRLGELVPALTERGHAALSAA